MLKLQYREMVRYIRKNKLTLQFGNENCAVGIFCASHNCYWHGMFANSEFVKNTGVSVQNLKQMEMGFEGWNMGFYTDRRLIRLNANPKNRYYKIGKKLRENMDKINRGENV